MPIAASKKKKLGIEIRKQRNKEKLALRKVASECGISPAALSDIENGINFPSETTFLRLVEILRFSDRPKAYDLYAGLKETAPPDVVEFLTRDKAAVAQVRALMNKGNEVANL